MKVSFDFDNTLSTPQMQEFAAELLSLGVEVYVVTSRYDDLHRHRYPTNPTNADLYAVTDSLFIPRQNIRFQCMRPKQEYLFKSTIDYHIDDDEVEIQEITTNYNSENYLATLGVLYDQSKSISENHSLRHIKSVASCNYIALGLNNQSK